MISDSIFTSQVKSLISRTFGRSAAHDSVLDRAINFFTSHAFAAHQKELLTEKVDKLQSQLSKAKGNSKKAIEQQLNQVNTKLLGFGEQDTSARKTRYEHLFNICEEIISLTEGEDFNENNRKSAQFLGTIQLFSPTEGAKISQNNEQCKSIYKAVLSLRMLDALCIAGQVNDEYVKHYLQDIPADKFKNFATEAPEAYQEFVLWVKIPIVMAALIQDIGNFHPDAQEILLGENADQDPHRTLLIEERKQLLQINYRETVRYFITGLGEQAYFGNSRDDRDNFVQAEQKRLVFVRHLLKSSVHPKEGIGNLLKVPQIYTSIILSTKANYQYKLLPKVYQVLNQNAERGNCSQKAVDILYRITGMFPQGYGVTYIPSESDGSPSDCYEYAIVNRLYPDNPLHPKCRIATRKLGFIGFGQDITISKDRNLYFPETVKKMSSISKERLNEILELLASNYKERQDLDLLPRCWHTKDFFSMKNNQKLWVKLT
ncbi:hypothetical protein [Thalassotalea sp. PLHSN55]|uniref:hypothetical protein n=1 Tax=Thalassotalea sp. PLHSN55 TaxID=3435888 RepID=UPI003F865C33